MLSFLAFKFEIPDEVELFDVSQSSEETEPSEERIGNFVLLKVYLLVSINSVYKA